MLQWLKDNWPWLLSYALTLLNGLLPHLPAGKAQTLVGKVVTVLRWALDFASPTAAKDDPRTVKLPFTWSKPAETK